jgi:alpha-tubulin suppressor-like RCC1 family protein
MNKKFLPQSSLRHFALTLGSVLLAAGCLLVLLWCLPGEAAQAAELPRPLAQGGGPYTTTLTIQTPASERADGRFMVGYAVWVNVTVTPDGAPGGLTPDGMLNVSTSGGTSNPTCSATVTDGAGGCALFFASTGSYTIQAQFDGSSTWRDSSNTWSSLTIIALESISALTAGNRHTCFLNAAGQFSCWGSGYETTSISNTTAIDAGDYSTCILGTNGRIQCFSEDSNFVNSVITTTNFLGLSAGAGHACGVDVNRNIRCWGTLGGGLLSARTDTTYRQVSAGNANDCAIRTSGSVVCWGANAWSAPAGTYTALAVGNQHACGIRSDGTLACWGNISLTPPGGSSFVQVDSGSDYSCARDNSGRLSCWGSTSPAVDTQTAFTTLGAGFLHTCALRPKPPSGSYLACWGDNTYAQAPQLSLTPNSMTAYLPQGRPYSQLFTPGGGSPAYTMSMQGSVAGLALNAWTLQGSPTTVGAYNFSLTVQENFAASSLPLELNPRVVAYATQVENPATSVSISTNPSETVAGTPIIVTVHVTDSGTPALTGSVIITGTDTTTGTLENTCTTQVIGGQASCSLAFASAGSKTFTAAYLGDAFYRPSPAAQTTVQINAAVITPALSAGTGYTCVSNSTGQVDCWGKNDSGQASPPVGVFSVLSAGDNHACGRSLNGSLACWGWDGWGKATPPVGYDFSSVSAGLLHTCGLRYDGSVICWGSSSDGQLSAPGMNFAQISAGDYHTCGLNGSGLAFCWGRNTSGQANPPGGGIAYTHVSAGGAFTCGIRAADGSLACWGSLTTAPAGTNYLALDAGRGHACALDSANHLVCWGSNTSGQASVPEPSATFSAVSAGATHTCALKSDGSLLCWGSNSDGQAPTISISPTALPTIDVNIPWSQTFAATGGREALYRFTQAGSWPPGLLLDANSGQLSGTPTQPGVYTYTVRAAERTLTPAISGERTFTQVIRSAVAVQIVHFSPVTGTVGLPVQVTVQVSETPGNVMGVSPTLTVTVRANDGTGCNFQLVNGGGSCYLFFTSTGTKQIQASYAGDGRFKAGQSAAANLPVQPPVQMPKLYTSRSATLVHGVDGKLQCLGAACSSFNLSGTYSAVSVGETELCVLQTDGQVLCQPFGAGYAAATLHTGPYVALSVGAAHACAITPTGAMTCWGENSAGQATPLPGSYLAVSAGDTHTCAIRSDHSLACWGNPPAGTIPTGSFLALSTGPDHTCAIRSDHSVACWGSNSAGQSTPPGGQFISIGVGQAHSCGVQADGRVACWGDNTFGQRQAPYGTFTTLTAAKDHNCALRPGIRLTCWGKNDYGEAPAIGVNPLGGAAAQVVIPALKHWEHAFYPLGGVKPYQAGLSSGILPPGTALGVTLSPAGTILYGIPQVPGVYPFVLYWEDSGAIPLKSEQPYTITVTGVDLQVNIVPDHPTTALFMNAFGYVVTVTNETLFAAPNVALTVTLPGGLSNISASNLAGCILASQQLRCDFSSLPAHSSQAITITGLVTTATGADLTLSAQAFSQDANWPEVAPADNQKQVTVKVAQTNPIFFDPFDAPNPAWTGGTLIAAPSGVHYLGDFVYSDTLRLRLNDLPAHQRIQISFELYVIGPWQGSTGTLPGLWQFGYNGQTPWVSTTFSNLPGAAQNFPSNYPLGNYPWRTGAMGTDELGYSGVVDTRYQLAISQIHNTSDLDVIFQSLNLPAGVRWGIDNVRIVLDWSQYAIYLPLTAK